MYITVVLIISMLSASIAQVLFKIGIRNVGEIQQINLQTIIQILFNKYVDIGFLLYVISFSLWFVALSKKDLNFVYPFTGLTFAFVFFMSYFILGESISRNVILGSSFIIIGILILSKGA